MNNDLFINMQQHPFITFYCVGVLVAFIFGCIEGWLMDNDGEDISEFPAMIVPFSLTSWFGIYILAEEHIKRNKRNKHNKHNEK